MLFESQSRDLTTELFTRKAVAPAITNPLECFVTAWCVANSDPTSEWKLTFYDMSLLEKFLEHFQRLSIGSSSTSLSSSFTGSIVQITMTFESRQHLISEHGEVKRGENRAEKLAHSMSSLCPCLGCLMFWITTADIPLVVSFLCIAVQMVPLKTIIIINNRSDEDELGAAPPLRCPSLHCPSLKTVWLIGETSVAAPLIQSLILPNINTLTKILLIKCRPRSGSEFNNFCSCLCQSTSLEHVICGSDVDLNAHERKQLASALEQIKSLKVAIYIPIEDIDCDRYFDYEDSLSKNRIGRLKENIMSFYKKLYLLRRRSRLMCVISLMLIDSHSVSQNPVTIDMFDVISLDMFDDNSTEEGQEENEVALQTAAELQDDENYDLLLTLMFSIETAQDEQKRRQVEQQQALQSENEQGEIKKESAEGEDVQFPLAPSSMQAAEDEQRKREGEQQQLALKSEHEQDLSGDDQSAENDPNKEKLKNFKEQQQESHKDEQTRKEEEQEESAAAETLASYHPEDLISKSQGENEMGLQTASAEKQDDNLQLVLSASIQTAKNEQRKKEEEQQQQASQSKEYRQKALQSADEQDKETVCGTMQSAEQDEEVEWQAIEQ